MPSIQFTKDVAGTLEFYASKGVPDSAASLTIYTSAQSTLDGETWPLAVALGATSTLTALAERHTNVLSLTSASGFVAGQRVFISFYGKFVEVTIDYIIGNDLYLEQALRTEIPAVAVVASHRLSYSLSSTQTATLRKRYRAVWSYVVNGVAHSQAQYFDVVREPFQIDISEADIEHHDGSFGEVAGSSSAWRTLIKGAHDDIETELRALQLEPELIRDREALKAALIFQFLSKFYGQTTPAQMDKSERWEARAGRKIDAMSRAKTWYDANNDSAPTSDGISGDGTGSTITDSSGNVLERLASGEVRYHSGASELGTPAAYMQVG